MTLQIHRPYPGVALVVTEAGSVLLGAPADAFKATKRYCSERSLPFPRVLVAPPMPLVGAYAQFAPEFFLYDFLFIYGAAFKPELAGERLQLVTSVDQIEGERLALEHTLTGPSRHEMQSYTDSSGAPIMAAQAVAELARVSESMAIKGKDGLPRKVDDMAELLPFDSQGGIALLNGALELQRTATGFRVRAGSKQEDVDLTVSGPVTPFATLPPPTTAQTPGTFAIKALGTRSGFDLSGPTTGFLMWVNGRMVMYDGPVGTGYLLARQGISLSDLDAVILSHCHEDHMGAFTELVLAGRRPTVFTAEPIYRSMLVKLGRCFNMSEADVASIVNYVRVTPGEPLSLFGATFDFFHTVHAIPTLGVRVGMSSTGGTRHQIQISGDTMHHEGLDKMRSDGVITKEKHAEMRNLVPEQRVSNAHYFADVGEAIIHGHPKDWQGNPNQLYYYHCPDNEHVRSFGHTLATPGETYTLIEPRQIHPAVPGRLITALAFLDLKDARWLSTLLHHGRTRTVEAGEVLVSNSDLGTTQSTFSVIVSGTARVADPQGQALADLHAGELFGLVELVDQHGRYTATITAETPMELFEVDANLLHELVHWEGLEQALQRVWRHRPKVESVGLFRDLDAGVKGRIAAMGTEESFPKGSVVIEQGTMGDDFFLLVDGEVEIERQGQRVRNLRASDHDNFFGEISAVFPTRPRSATVRARTAVELLRVRGAHVRQLFEHDAAIHYRLVLAMHDRSQPTMP